MGTGACKCKVAQRTTIYGPRLFVNAAYIIFGDCPGNNVDVDAIFLLNSMNARSIPAGTRTTHASLYRAWLKPSERMDAQT